MDSMDQRFDVVDGRLDKMDSRFEVVDGRFDGIDGRLDHHSQMLADLLEVVTDQKRLGVDMTETLFVPDVAASNAPSIKTWPSSPGGRMISRHG